MQSAFVSFAKEIQELLARIVQEPMLHARFLNTLSYLENCGARKIAACEHPTRVKEEMLKHAAEEFRHAHYLKGQLARIGPVFEDYRLPHLLGGFSTLHYLDALEIQAVRLIQTRREEKQLAYLLVTYAIELRASELYPLYQSILKKSGSKVQVQSILLEEKEHLAEMEKELESIPSCNDLVVAISQIEGALCQNWLKNLLSKKNNLHKYKIC
jgi:hypothetical protein